MIWSPLWINASCDSESQAQAFDGKLEAVKGQKPDKAVESLTEIWQSSMESEEQPLKELLAGLTAEAVLLERSTLRENRFRLLLGAM